MTLPKFILAIGGHLSLSGQSTSRSVAFFRMGMVNQHVDLLKPGEQCLGGGYYSIDYTTNTIILDRSSYDFGRPRWHLIDTLAIPTAYQGMRLVYRYDDRYHDDFDVSGSLRIVYQTF